MNNAAPSPSDDGRTLMDDPAPSPEKRPRMASETPLIREYWAILLRQKWVVAGIVALALLAGLALTLMATPQYSSSAQIGRAHV